MLRKLCVLESEKKRKDGEVCQVMRVGEKIRLESEH